MLRSPITNTPLESSQLLPSPQVRNLISSLISIGTITGELADTWSQKQKDREEADLLLKQANEDDDKDAMYKLYYLYKNGSNSFVRQDYHKAYESLQRANLAGSVKATALWGEVLCTSQLGSVEELNAELGVRKDQMTGMLLIMHAAQKGSDRAAYLLGRAIAEGMYGMTEDLTEANRSLEISLSHSECDYRHMHESMLKQARELLNKVSGELVRILAEGPMNASDDEGDY